MLVGKNTYKTVGKHNQSCGLGAVIIALLDADYQEIGHSNGFIITWILNQIIMYSKVKLEAG